MIGTKKGRTVAARVAARIRDVSPLGLGHWEPAWGFVANPSDVFMDALAEWETDDTLSTRSKLEAASADLIATWAEGARQWREAGRPGLEKTDASEAEAGVGEVVS